MTTIFEPLSTSFRPLATDNSSDNLTITVDRLNLAAGSPEENNSTPFTVEFPNITDNEPTYNQLAGSLFGAFCINVYPRITGDAPTNYATELIYATEINSFANNYGGYTYFNSYKGLVDEFTFLFNESNIDENTGIIDIDLNNDGTIDGNDATGLTSKDVQNMIWYWVQNNTVFSGRTTYGSTTLDTTQVVNLANQITDLADDFNDTGIGYLQTQIDNSPDGISNFNIPVFLLNEPSDPNGTQPLITFIEFSTGTAPAPEDPSISILKEVVNPPTEIDPEGNPIYNVGENVTFSYTVSNTGNVDIEQVLLIDDNATPDDATDDITLEWDGAQVVAFVGEEELPADSVNFSSSLNDDVVLNETEEWTFTVTKPTQFEDSLEKVCEIDPCDFIIEDAFSGGNIQTTVTLTEIDGGVQVDVVVSDPALIGDIRGVFFDINGVEDNQDLPLDIGITGTDVTSSEIDANNIIRIEKDVLMKGGGTDSFDAGVQIGTQGMSTDDIQSTSFDVQGLTIDDLLGQRFGIRLTSVGLDGGSREDSSKIVGYAPPECDTTCTQIQTNLAGVDGFVGEELVGDGFDANGDLVNLGTNSQTIMVMG